MTPRRQITEPSEATVREWRKRRLLFALPAAILAVSAIANLYLQHGAATGLWWLVGLAVLMGAIYGGVFWRERRFRHRATPDVLLDTFGRFTLTEWAKTPELRSALAGLDGRHLNRWARGLAEGRVAFTAQELRFHPGRLATKDRVPTITLPWRSVDRAEVVREAVSLGCGLRLALSGGNTVLDLEVRGRPTAIRAVLERTSLT